MGGVDDAWGAALLRSRKIAPADGHCDRGTVVQRAELGAVVIAERLAVVKAGDTLQHDRHAVRIEAPVATLGRRRPTVSGYGTSGHSVTRRCTAPAGRQCTGQGESWDATKGDWN